MDKNQDLRSAILLFSVATGKSYVVGTLIQVRFWSRNSDVRIHASVRNNYTVTCVECRTESLGGLLNGRTSDLGDSYLTGLPTNLGFNGGLFDFGPQSSHTVKVQYTTQPYSRSVMVPLLLHRHFL
jgi:hypothetical protein